MQTKATLFGDDLKGLEVLHSKQNCARAIFKSMFLSVNIYRLAMDF